MSDADDYREDAEIVGERSIDDLLADAAQSGWFEPGTFHDDVPAHIYHRGPGISSSGLKRIGQSPAHYWIEKQHPKPRTAAMAIGEAYHCLTLEPDKFAAVYVRCPFDSYRTKDAKQWREDVIAEGRIPLSSYSDDPIWSPSEWDLIHHMADATRNHPIVRYMLELGTAERTIVWREPVDLRDGVERHELCKVRFDWIDRTHDLGIDLKSTTDASFSGFARAVHDFEYHLSRALYMRGQAALSMGLKEFVLVAQEKAPPYACAAYTLNADAKFLGEALCDARLRTYSQCLESGEWPAYPIEPRDLILPAYALRQNIR